MKQTKISPLVFLDDSLIDLEQKTKLPIRIAYIGLLCAADKEGRLTESARALGAQILPYDNVDFSAVIKELLNAGYLDVHDDAVNHFWLTMYREHTKAS